MKTKYILEELDKFDLIHPTDEAIKRYYSILTTTTEEYEEEIRNEIKELQIRISDYEEKRHGTEEQYQNDLEELKSLQLEQDDFLTVEQKKDYLTNYIMEDMLKNDEITFEDSDDFYANYDKYIEEYIQYKKSDKVLNDYIQVDLLKEFKDIKNIDKLNSFFQKNHWVLLKTEDNFYQLYFGKDTQVDNMFEYAFSYLLNEKTTKNELERLINYRMELDKESNIGEKEIEII